jgi:PHD/YefM family antitoxin component YafN of YafNO toxin-antitoxin module
MTIISANDLKIRGISAIARALQERTEVTVTVRGKARYVFMSNERYQYLRECELEVALAESKVDLEADSSVRESVTQHLTHIGEINKKVR